MHDPAPNLIFRQLFDPESSTYTYLLADPATLEGVLIDPVYEQTERDLGLIRDLGVKLLYILETHVHADHVTGADRIREVTGAKVALSEGAGVSCADWLLKEGDVVNFGRHRLSALATPGHTSGCMSYAGESRVFTGDALMIRACGRTDFQSGSAEMLYRSVHEKLFRLPDETLVYPAHDYKGMTCTSIGEEKRLNPRLKLQNTRERFVEIMGGLKLAYPKKIDVAVPANQRCGRTAEL